MSEDDKPTEVIGLWLESAGVASRYRTASLFMGEVKRTGIPALTVPPDVVWPVGD